MLTFDQKMGNFILKVQWIRQFPENPFRSEIVDNLQRWPSSHFRNGTWEISFISICSFLQFPVSHQGKKMTENQIVNGNLSAIPFCWFADSGKTLISTVSSDQIYDYIYDL